MIILITGASHTGKTLLAHGNTSLTPEDDDALTDYLWPIIQEMMKTAIENHQDLIVEGCYIPFDWRKYFDERYLPSIRFVCLAMSDAFIDAHFDEIKNHNSDIETRLYDMGFTADTLKEDNHYYINGFAQYGERVMLIDTDYEDIINAILENN